MPADFHLEVKGLDKLVAAASKAGPEWVKMLKEAMIRSTSRIKNDIRENLTANGTSNTGNLRRSVFVDKAEHDIGVVGVGERYGGAVEYGRPAGRMPPVDPIERWARTKLGKPGLGWPIAMKIKQRGTRAQPFVEPAFTGNIDYVQTQFNHASDMLVQMLGD